MAHCARMCGELLAPSRLSPRQSRRQLRARHDPLRLTDGMQVFGEFDPCKMLCTFRLGDQKPSPRAASPMVAIRPRSECFVKSIYNCIHHLSSAYIYIYIYIYVYMYAYIYIYMYAYIYIYIYIPISYTTRLLDGARTAPVRQIREQRTENLGFTGLDVDPRRCLFHLGWNPSERMRLPKHLNSGSLVLWTLSNHLDLQWYKGIYVCIIAVSVYYICIITFIYK